VLPAGLDSGRDRGGELVEDPPRLDLELLPIGPAGELAELLLPLRDPGRRDAEPRELGEPFVDVPLYRLRGLALLTERLGLLLEYPGQPGGRERPQASLTGRRSPPCTRPLPDSRG